jgi:transcriptional regulator with XRE-family HTH domain
MSSPAEASELQKRVAVPLARTVRRGRSDRGWTLDAFALRSGVSRRLIVQIEQGQANPSIGTLLRLAEALGLTLSALLGEEPALAYSIERRGDERELWSGARGGSGRLLISHGPLELWSWELAPGESHESEPHRAGSWEILSVSNGALRVDVGDETFALGLGDRAWIDGARPHAYRNAGRRTTRFAMVVLEP